MEGGSFKKHSVGKRPASVWNGAAQSQIVSLVGIYLENSQKLTIVNTNILS